MKKSFLNTDVVFCKKCVESNQRFVSSIQNPINLEQILMMIIFVMLVCILRKNLKQTGKKEKKN